MTYLFSSQKLFYLYISLKKKRRAILVTTLLFPKSNTVGRIRKIEYQPNPPNSPPNRRCLKKVF
nr:MAG TPA: hypothetical protein [Caudoviricetes sp.]